MKTAVLNYVKKQDEITEQDKANIAASFQEAVVDVLKEKVRRAIVKTGHKQVVIAGGVAANRRLRSELKNMANAMGVELFYPPLEYCTDNAAMIAAAGVMYYQKGWFSDLEIGAVPNLKLQ
jgi:N6-L-threonylcarbamoyladenine synthase